MTFFPCAEYVPPPIPGLPTRTPDFSSVTGSLTTSSELFQKLQSNDNSPCISPADIKAKLPDKCEPKKDDPVVLDKSHCDDLFYTVLDDIEKYAGRIEVVPVKDTSHRWPKPPMYCVWDCGKNWDGPDDQPLHAGLDDELKGALLDQLKVWNQTCYGWAETKTWCLSRPNATSIRNSIERARRSEYTQVSFSFEQYDSIQHG